MSFQNIEGGGRCCTERVCIQVKKVFDACLNQATAENTSIVCTQVLPPSFTTPLQFVSGKSTSCVGRVTNLTVERLPEKQNFGRVQCDVEIPVEVCFIDYHCIECRGEGSIVVHEDVVMYLPDAAIMPYEVDASVSTVCPNGTYSGMNQGNPEFNVIACITVILKITMPVELLIPAYGYAEIPPCQEYAQEICESFFELPLFPRNNG